MLIFQLTSSRRGWLCTASYCLCYPYFNSHPHEEDDLSIGSYLNQFLAFQLTSSRRGWQYILGLLLGNLVFQLTSSRRGWRNRSSCGDLKRYFNSHPHEEDDSKIDKLIIYADISTHILTKRMTLYCKLLLVLPLFQLTSSRRGWRLVVGVVAAQIGLFQLTSSRRGWHWKAKRF